MSAAPLGRRSCRVVEASATGGYRMLRVLDPEGPVPRAGQFYMLEAERGWGGGGGHPEPGRPFLPRACSVAGAEPADDGVALAFLLEDVGPGSGALTGLGEGERVLAMGPLGRAFSAPRELVPGAAGAILVGGGVGIAPLAVLRGELRAANVPVQTLLGFRDRSHAGGLELFSRGGATEAPPLCPGVRLASEDGHAGYAGYVTDLLAQALAGDAAGSAAVYACGPPAMLEEVRAMCAGKGIAAELAMEAPMACGFGACFGCAVPVAEGGYIRLCLDGPVVGAERLRSALVAGSGH